MQYDQLNSLEREREREKITILIGIIIALVSYCLLLSNKRSRDIEQWNIEQLGDQIEYSH